MPIKRNESLKQLSRDHHHALLLCWKIRKGLKQNVKSSRIRLYVELFYHEHLSQHFWEEETHLFPLLGADDANIKRAVREHRRLERLILEEQDNLKAVSLIEEELEAHVRFEERTLFNILQEKVPEQKLLEVLSLHKSADANRLENWTDRFWE